MSMQMQLKRAYAKRLNLLNKNFFKEQNSGLNIFVEYLRFKRDSLALTCSNKSGLAALATAIAEFEAFQTCQEARQKEFHWNSFCNFVKLNTEDWQTLDDSI